MTSYQASYDPFFRAAGLSRPIQPLREGRNLSTVQFNTIYYQNAPQDADVPAACYRLEHE